MSSSNKKTTASGSEIKKFTAISNSWWDSSGSFKLLHKINPVRLNFILQNTIPHFELNIVSAKPLTDIKVLDIGCGGGILCEPLARLGASVTGIDAGKENILAAKKHAKDLGLNINYLTILPEEILKKQISFDIVINMEIIEHTENLDLLLECSSALVKPGGIMFVSTLNRNLKSLLFAKIAAEYILSWLPVGTHNWKQFVRPMELSNQLKKFGLVVEKFSGIAYKVSSDTWVLNDNLSVNYIAFSAKQP